MNDESCCPCDNIKEPGLEVIGAGLPSIPRQIRSFHEARRALLAAIPSMPALADWRAREGSDFGLLWLEMWAYVLDVLNFYDERIANESYIRTASRNVSLRRLVELLGHVPKPGVAGTSTIAAIVEGRQPIALPPPVAVRSSAFGNEKPQVFETETPASADAFRNQWAIGPFLVPRDVEPEAPGPAPSLPKEKKKKFLIFGIPLPSSTTGEARNTLLFETEGFGLAKDRVLYLEGKNPAAAAKFSRVATLTTETRSIEGKDGRTYAEASVDPTVTISRNLEVSDVRAATPTVVATVSRQPVVRVNPDTQLVELIPLGNDEVALDAVYKQVKKGDRLVLLGAGNPTVFDVTSIRDVTVRLGDNGPLVPVTALTLPGFLLVKVAVLQGQLDFDQLTFHFAFVDAGALTRVRDTEIPATALADPAGVPISGIVETPPDAKLGADVAGTAGLSGLSGILQQRFLIQDADQVGALVDGRMVFTTDGSARFNVIDPAQLPATSFKTPITVYGNLLEVSRGESVVNEVLGSGDAKVVRQQFRLKKKPLTYFHKPSASGDPQAVSTLQIRVNGVLWTEVKSFFGCGPRDEVYTVRHDELQNTTIMFGDGVRGARLPSGVGNVIARYRFGAGRAAPPAGAIRQLSKSVKGLRRVVSPIAALEGKDPDSPASLKTSAPKTALLLKRAVSVADFEAIAQQAPGVVQATAQFLWLPSQMQAGVLVHYIGSTSEERLTDTLRLLAEPTVAIEVMKAEPIAATLELGIEVDPRFVKDDVARAVRDRLVHEETGLLAPRNASIGGSFFPSRVYDAALDVPGVIGVSGATFKNAGIEVPSHGAVCIPTGHFLDFSAPDAVTVVGVDPIGSAPQIRVRHAESNG